MEPLRLIIRLPSWCEQEERVGTVYPTALDRMRLVVELAARNVEEGSGGPFGAAIFGASSGRLLSVGVNSVVRLNNAMLHAETVTLMRASARLERFSLAPADGGNGGELVELYTSCEPCAMCLGAILWSGVRRVVFAARRDDAERLGFDEGPVFPETFAYLRRRGIRVESGPLRDDARKLMERYRAVGGAIYNG